MFRKIECDGCEVVRTAGGLGPVTGPTDPLIPAQLGPPLTLTGPVVVLEPLASGHCAELAAAGADRDGLEYTAIPGTVAEAERFVGAAHGDAAKGRRWGFAVRCVADGAVVGSSSFINPLRWTDDDPHRVVSTVEIGATWFAASARGTMVNPAAKLLMLGHAFDRWGARRVEFRVDARNERSRRAMVKLGAVAEGVLRSVQPGKGRDGAGGPRDTTIFSVLAGEWQAVRAGLLERLADPPT